MKTGVKSLLLFCCLWLASCSQDEKVPHDLIQPVEMSNILLDMQIADVYNDSYIPDSFNLPKDRQERIKIFYQQVLMLHHTDTLHFLKSYRYYENRPDLMNKLYDRMMDSINQKKSYQEAIVQKRLRIKNKLRSASSDTIGNLEKFFLLKQAITDSIHNQASRIFYPDLFN